MLAGRAIDLDEKVVQQAAHSAEALGSVVTGVVSEVERAPVYEQAAVDQLDLDLTRSLQLAARHSRELQNAREALYLDTLSLFGTRRDYGLGLAGSVSYILNRDETAEDTQAGGQLSAEQILPTGGRASLSGDVSQREDRPDGGASSTGYRSGARLRLDQPLLAGAA